MRRLSDPEVAASLQKMTSSLSYGHANASSRSLFMRVLPGLRARVLAVIGLAVVVFFGFFAIERGSRHGAASQSSSALRTGRGLTGIDDGLPPPTAAEFAALRDDVLAISRSIDMRSTDATVLSLTRQLEDVVRTVASLQESVQSLDDNTSKLTQMVLLLKEQQTAPRIQERQNPEVQIQLLELSASATNMDKQVASMSATLRSVETSQVDHADELKALTGRVAALEATSITVREDMERVSVSLASVATDVSNVRRVEVQSHTGAQANTGTEQIKDAKLPGETKDADPRKNSPGADGIITAAGQITGEAPLRPMQGPAPGSRGDTATRNHATRGDIADASRDEDVARPAPQAKAEGDGGHRDAPSPRTAKDVQESAQEQAEIPNRQQSIRSQDRDQIRSADVERAAIGRADVQELPGDGVESREDAPRGRDYLAVARGPKLAADRESTIQSPAAHAQRSETRAVVVQQQDHAGSQTEKPATKERALAATLGDAAPPVKPQAVSQEATLSQRQKSPLDGANGVQQPRALNSAAETQAGDTAALEHLSRDFTRDANRAAGIQQASQANAALDGNVQIPRKQEQSNLGLGAVDGDAGPEVVNEPQTNLLVSRAGDQHEGEKVSGDQWDAGQPRPDGVFTEKQPSNAGTGGDLASAPEAAGTMQMPEAEHGVSKAVAGSFSRNQRLGRAETLDDRGDRDADNVGAAAMPQGKAPSIADNLQEAEQEPEPKARGGNNHADVLLAGDLGKVGDGAGDQPEAVEPGLPAPPRPRFVR